MDQEARSDASNVDGEWIVGSTVDQAPGTSSEPAMRVDVVRLSPDSHSEFRSPWIRILVPCEQCAFHALHRTSDGRLQRTFVRAPHVAVIADGQLHAVYGAGRSDVIVMQLDPAFFEAKARDVPQWQGPLAGRFAAVDPFLREVGNALRSQLPFDTESSAYLQSVASVVSVHLARNYGAAGGGKPAYIGLAPHKLKRVQQYIADHIGEAIPVKQLAGTVHMSAYHFARMFRKATGQPPHLYITMQRVEHAKALLEEARQSLGEIAASVGFQTQSHFTEVFRKHSGMTPGAYRARCELSAAIGLRDPSATPTTSVTGADSASLR